MSAPAIGRRGAVPVLVAVGLAQVAVVLDYYSLNMALPTMADDFGVTTTDMQWVLSAYLLGFASLLVVGGRLGDMLGRRRVLEAGIVVFGLASALCAVAPDEGVLVAFRVLQAAGAALLFPVSMAALNHAFPEARRAWAIGIVVGVANVGTALGPFVGGALTGTLGWRWVFLINVPIAIGALVMVRLALDESRDPDAPRRVDVAGCALLAAGVVGVALAIDRAQAWPPAGVAACAAGGVALLVAFVLWERRVPAPLVDLGLAANRRFRRILSAGCLANYGWAGSVLLVTLYLQQVRGYGPLEAGTLFLAMSAGTAAGGPLSGRLAARLPHEAVMAGSLVVAVAGLLWLAQGGPIPAYLGALLVTGLGMGTAYGMVNIGTLAAVDPAQGGQASGVTFTLMVLSAAVAVTSGGLLVEALGGGAGAAPEGDAIASVLRIGAVVTAAGLAVLLPAVLRRSPAAAAEG